MSLWFYLTDFRIKLDWQVKGSAGLYHADSITRSERPSSWSSAVSLRIRNWGQRFVFFSFPILWVKGGAIFAFFFSFFSS